MAKEIMNNIELEIKAIAKAMGESMRRAGHVVPNSVVLHAFAAAVDKRDWFKLKSSIKEGGQKDVGKAVSLEVKPSFSETTWCLLRLALYVGKPVLDLTGTDEVVAERASAQIGATVACQVYYGFKCVPAAWDIQRNSLVFEPSENGNYQYRGTINSVNNLLEPVMLNIEQSPVGDYVVTGLEITAKQLAREISQEFVYAAARSLPGPVVWARYYTDGGEVSVIFDARPYFQQASDQQIQELWKIGLSGDYEADNVAEYIADHKLDANLVRGFDFKDNVNALTTRKEPLGFEVQVDEASYFAWMDIYRPYLLADQLCERHAVQVVQQGDSWIWQSGEVVGKPLGCREEAVINAYRTLNLMAK